MNNELQQIRASCNVLLPYATADKLKYFIFDENNLYKAADYVSEVIYANYPDLNIPYHSRLRHLPTEYKNLDLGSLIEVVIISVLLDAGAGSEWRYKDKITNKVFTKSEGLGIASYRMYTNFHFPTELQFYESFQICDSNKLVGISDRYAILQRLINSDYGASPLQKITEFFLLEPYGSTISVAAIFFKLKVELQDVLPSDVAIYKGYNIYFYKLLQWLCYSLWEVLEIFGYKIIDTEMLTGLPEYRNGGLMVDLSALIPRDKKMYELQHEVSSEFIVEWRAMTIILLDQIAILIRHKLNKNHIELPLSKILQGGTWYAGRKIALELRADGAPPFKIIRNAAIF